MVLPALGMASAGATTAGLSAGGAALAGTGAAILSGAKATGEAISDAGDKMFGTGSTPGLMGTGTQRYNPYDINMQVADRSADGQRLMGQSQDILNNAQNRQAPTMKAAQIANNERVGGINIGNIERAQAANTGPASQMQAATINRGEDQQVRNVQMQNIDRLNQAAAGNGPSVATMQIAQAQDRAAKQARSMAASAPGQGNAALAARSAQNSLAESNQQAARDAAMMRVQEQQNAQSALVGATGNTRGQDIGVNTQQAQFGQDAANQNMMANNQFALQNAQFNQQANLTNAAAFNARQSDQANMNWQVNQFNAQQQNALNLNRATFQQQAGTSNLDAYLKNQGMNDAQVQAMMSNQIGMNEADRQAAIKMQDMKTQQDIAIKTLEQKAYEASAARNSGVMGGLIGGASSLLGISDEKQKTGIKKLSEKDLDEIYGPQKLAPETTADGGSEAPTIDEPTPTAKAKDKTKPDLSKMKGGGANPMGIFGGAAANVGQGLGQALSNSMLGDVLNPGSKSVLPTPQDPQGGYKAAPGGGIDPNATIASINRETIYNPTRHPGAQPMGGGGFQLGPFRLSDEHQKSSISKADKELSKDFDKLGAYEYNYKHPDMPGAGHGRYTSPMAQEFEKTDMMKDNVIDTPNGKMMNYDAKAVGKLFAGMAMLNRKVDALSKGKR